MTAAPPGYSTPGPGHLDNTDVWVPGFGLRRRADGRVFILAAAAAVLTDLAVRSGVATLTGSALVVLVAGATLVSGRLRQPQARGLVALAPLFGVWLTVHTSMWLLPLDIIAVAGLLVLAASLESGGSLFDLSLPAVIARGIHAMAHAAASPAFLVRGDHEDSSVTGTVSAKAVLQGVGLALPILW